MQEQMSTHADALKIASGLVALGVPVFTCKLNEKGDPLPPKDWQHTKPDPEVIKTWREGEGLCAVTGHTFDVLDVDPRNGGLESHAALVEELGEDYPTVYGRSHTASGGWHEWIAPLGIHKQTKFWAGLDYLGGQPDEKGRAFVFLAPTVRPSKDESNLGELVKYAWELVPDSEPLLSDKTGDRLRKIVLSSGDKKERKDNGTGSVAYQKLCAILDEKGFAGEGSNYHCPGHDDESPSLSVTDAGNKVLIRCHTGWNTTCPPHLILKAIGLTMEDLFDDKKEGKAAQESEEAEKDSLEKDIQAEKRRQFIRDAAKRLLQSEKAAGIDDEFEFLKFSELSDEEFTYRIPGILPMGCHVVFSAYRKAGKTRTVLSFVKALTSKDDFLNEFPCVTVAGKVVYVNLELGDKMLKEYAREAGLDLTSDKLRVIQLRGQAGKIRILDPEWRVKFAARLKDIDCEVLIIDPLSPVLAVHGIDADNNDQVRQVLEGFGEIAASADIEHVVIVDHTGHADQSRSRGASAKGDWPDVMWNIERKGDTRTFTADGRMASGKFEIIRDPVTKDLGVKLLADIDGGDQADTVAMIGMNPDISTKDLRTKLQAAGMHLGSQSHFSDKLREYESEGKIVREQAYKTATAYWRISS